jgi:hypothetical protein
MKKRKRADEILEEAKKKVAKKLSDSPKPKEANLVTSY